MQYLFARANSEVLAQLAWTRSLLSFDFDGTLAPIVANRHAAAMRSTTVTLLDAASQIYPCAVISGRSHADLSRRLARVRFERVVSNHGFEAGRHDPTIARAIRGARESLQKALHDVQGVELEDKGYSLAIHYRRSRRRREARRAIAAAGKHLPATLRMMPGTLVVNVVHNRAPNKATAVLRLRQELGMDTVLYVGDGSSDEDVFELDQPGRLLSVRVGRSRGSNAPYFLRGQREIDHLLELLTELRTRRIAAGDA